MSITNKIHLRNIKQVFLVGLQGQTERRLRKLGVIEKVASTNIISDWLRQCAERNRTAALRQAVSYVGEHVVDFGHDTISPQAIG